MILLTLALLVLPARSAILAEKLCPAPWPKGCAGGQAPAKPEPGDASPQVKFAVGAPVTPLYQPVAAGLAGERLAVVVGVGASRLVVIGCVVDPPLLLAEQV